jgi:hypothetical protein
MLDHSLNFEHNQEKNNQQDWTKVTTLRIQIRDISLDRLKNDMLLDLVVPRKDDLSKMETVNPPTTVGQQLNIE